MRLSFIVLTAVLVLTAVAIGLGGGQDAAALPHWGHRIARTLSALMILLAMAGALLLLMEDRLVYHPTRSPAPDWDSRVLGVEECTFQTEDGLALHAVWHPGAETAAGGPRPVVLFCHGNAGNLTHRAQNVRLLAERGLAVLLFDYRGYGQSQGRPSEQGLYRDADAAWRYLVEVRGVDPARIVCFGRSLGAAVALRTATERPVAGLVMEGAFASIPAMARHEVPFVPVWFLARNRFDNLTRVPGLRVPLLTMHAERDELVPVGQGRAVFDAAPEPKDYYLVRGASHNDTYLADRDDYFSVLEAFCRRCVAGDSPRPGGRDELLDR